jgi:hypothetical protein
MISGTKPQEYYRDQYGIHPVFALWNKITDPPTGWVASKTSGWAADSFSGGLTVDFSSVVPVGTRAIRISLALYSAAGSVYYRKGGDTNISNTPQTSEEYSHCLFVNPTNDWAEVQVVIWLSNTYTADFAIQNVNSDLYLAYPVEYLI